MKVTMSQPIDPPRTVRIPSGRADDSDDDDDDDRRELISHYASDQYLSKWEQANDEEEGQEEGKEGEGLAQKDVEEDNETTKKKGHLVTASDCDGISLLSYNSVRDCTPSVTPKTVTTCTSVSYCVQPSLPSNEDLKLWQGYGGNIYFDAVRCQSMRINSAKSANTRKADAKRRKSKSCGPLDTEDLLQQYHASCAPSSLTGVPDTPIHSLGSLRMRSSRGRRCTEANCNEDLQSARRFSGKVCKGFSNKKHGRYNSAPEALMVSGGQVGDSALDPIDSVRQFNSLSRGKEIALGLGNRFPTLLSDGSSFFSHQGENRNSSAHAIDSDPFIRLPLLEKDGGKQETTAKTEEANTATDANGKQMSEPKQVFIIPFGAFDDPVEGDTSGDHTDSKRKLENHSKSASTTCKNSANAGKASTRTNSKKKGVNESDDLKTKPEPCDVSGCSHDGKDRACNACGSDENTNDTVPQMSNVLDNGRLPVYSGSPEHGLPDFHLKREISNVSLSNYLRAVPTRLPKSEDSTTTAKSSSVPRLTYTQRSKALPTFYMVNNSLHHMNRTAGRMGGSQVYGGYFPSTNRKESKVFYAEISACSTTETARESRGSCAGNNSAKKSNSSGLLPGRADVKASYVSRKVFSQQGREKAQRFNETLKNREKNLLPLTGHQISRSDGGVGGV